jgi:LysM repeat protein
VIIIIQGGTQMKRPVLILFAIILAVSLMLPSCTQNPEQNPVIVEKFQMIDQIAEDYDQISGKLKDIENDIDTINQDLTTLKQLPRSSGVASTELEGLKSRIRKQEGEISKLQSELSKLKKTIAAAVKSSAQSIRKSTEDVSVKKTTTVKKPDPTPLPKKRGKYYKVQKGDTLKSIAREFNTSSNSIRSENHIPDGKEPITGTRLYIIPGK